MRLVPTPLAVPPRLPEPRDGGVDLRILEAIVPAPGLQPTLDRLARPGAVVVTTGQQPGLFTGPLYTVYKALSAAALAAVLERRWGRPVVPLFWLATDDHDFAEASATAWPAADGSIRRAALPPRAADAPLTPMYREPLGEGAAAALAQLAEDLQAAQHREAVLAWLGRHYVPGATIGSAYAGALAELLAPLGIACLDASHRALKSLAAPWLVRAAAQARAIDAALVPLAADLEARGVGPGVAVGDGATLVMLEGSAGRDRLVTEGEGFMTRRGRERFSPQELAEVAAAAPERLSPNVLLRPVVESAILPTVAYVAGPGELRYFALTPPVYAALGVPAQRPVPRWSGVAVEPRVDRVLEKFGLPLEALLDPSGAAEAKVVRDQLPPDLVDAFARIRAAVEAEYGVVAREAAAIDPTLEKTVQGTKGQALKGADDLERKVVQHLKKRRETELGQLARARGLVLPDGRPQERTFTVAPFLAREGTAFLDAVRAEAEGWYARSLEAPGTGS